MTKLFAIVFVLAATAASSGAFAGTLHGGGRNDNPPTSKLDICVSIGGVCQPLQPIDPPVATYCDTHPNALSCTRTQPACRGGHKGPNGVTIQCQ